MVERWKCADCGAVFNDPDEASWKEDMNGEGWAWQTFTELYCPSCGAQEIERYYGEDEESAEED